MIKNIGGLAASGVILWAFTSSQALATSCGSFYFARPELVVLCDVEVDTPSNFKMVISGRGDVDGGATATFTYSGNWFTSHTWAFESVPTEDDVVTVTGLLYHKVAPHSEAAGPVFNYNGTLTYETPAYRKIESKEHGIHVDNFQAFGTVTDSEPSYFGDTISAWKVTVIATHVPEPETWSLVFVGLGTIAGQIKSRRRIVAL